MDPSETAPVDERVSQPQGVSVSETSPSPNLQPVASSPQFKAKKNPIFALLFLVLVGAIAAILFLYKENRRLTQKLADQTGVPNATSEATVSAIPQIIPTPAPTPTLPPGMKRYTNSEYGFEFIYPEAYKVLTDAKNLYGWPNGILLLYKGGQSYDMALQVWDTEEKAKAAYNPATYDFTVIPHGGKYFTLINILKSSDIANVITSFKFTKCNSDADCGTGKFCDISFPVVGSPTGTMECVTSCQKGADCASLKCAEFKITTGGLVTPKMGCVE